MTSLARAFARSVIAVALASTLARAQAQVIRGTVADSVSTRPIPGAVVSLLNVRGDVLARYVTGNRGDWQLPIREGTTRIRVIRIGFRPRETPVPAASGGAVTSTIRMVAIPTFLEPMRVDARQCPKRDDAGQALGLWEQVRAGLLASIVSREQNAPALVLLDYTRRHGGVDGPIEAFQLRRQDTQRSLNSYKAVRTATEFVNLGFASAGSSEGSAMFYAPDAEVLIDEGFANGYCFRVLRDRGRPYQVGLGFTAPDRRPGRVDIDGALWVDTIARRVVDIDYRYVGVHPRVDELRPSGNILFKEMPNGLTFIERWHIRMIGARIDSVDGPIGRAARTTFFTAVTGGELAHAKWPDSASYDARLARFVLTARNSSGSTAIGRTVKLLDTPYEKTLDPSGMFDVPDLLPGPYKLIIKEPRLEPLRMDSIPTRVAFEAKRGQTQMSAIVVPNLEEWVRERCEVGQGRLTERDSRLILGRLMDSTGKPIARASYEIQADYRAPGQAPVWNPVLDGGRTGSDGLFQLCTTESRVPVRSKELRISGKTPDGEPYTAVVPLNPEGLTLAPIVLDRVIPRE
jgi:hypothetical protein